MRFSSTKQLLVLMSVVVVAALAIYIGLFLYIRNANQEIAELTSAIDQQLLTESRLRSVESIMEDTEEEQEKLEGYFVGQDDIVGFIETIESLAGTVGLTIEITSVDVEEVGESEAYQFLKLRFDTEGLWGETTHFLALLEALPNAITIHRAVFNSKLEGEGASEWDGLFSIDVAMLK